MFPKKIILLTILIMTSLICFAAVYSSTDQNGNVYYSDTPTKNSTIISAPTTSHYQREPSTSTVPPLSTTTTTTNESNNPYTTFVITNPVDQQTFQNQRDIPITVNVEPALRATDKIRLLLDGAPYGAAESKMTISLFQVNRGSHQISAELIDENQTVIAKTSTITIFILYASVNNPVNNK